VSVALADVQLPDVPALGDAPDGAARPNMIPPAINSPLAIAIARPVTFFIGVSSRRLARSPGLVARKKCEWSIWAQWTTSCSRSIALTAQKVNALIPCSAPG
jgi:hypothetical protein